MRKFAALTTLVLISLALLYGVLSSLGKFVKTADLKKLAESRIGNLLQARVSVDEVKLGFLDQISLNGLKINQDVKNRAFYLLDIGQVVFKYNVSRFWRRDFDKPNTILFDSPQFLFQSRSLPSAWVEIDDLLEKGSQVADEVQFRKGRLSVHLPMQRVHFDLTPVQGKFKRVTPSRWRVGLEGRVSQMFKGVLELEGEVDQATKEFSIRIFMNQMRAANPEKLPVDGLDGVVHLTQEEIRFERVGLRFSRLPVKLEGSVLNYRRGLPHVDLRLSIGSRDMGVLFTVRDFHDGACDLEGELRYKGSRVPFRGRLFLKGEQFLVEDFELSDDFHGQGEWNWKQGILHLYLERNRQRIDVALNLNDGSIDFRLQADHFKVSGIDVVSRALFQLKPDRVLAADNKWAFDGKVRTDYLILDQIPFPDFQGTFHTTSSRVDRMNFQWGEGYSLNGSWGLEPPFPLDTRISWTGINLGKVRSLFAHPLPPRFEGLAEGDVRVRGEASGVEVEGQARVRGGAIGDFDYDELYLRFFGIPPYLKLRDSKLKRGMNTFYLMGGLDLRKENLFQDVEVTSSEKIVIWSGKNLGAGTRGETRLRSGIGLIEGLVSRSPDRSVDMGLRRAKGFRMSGEQDDEDEAYLALGPRVHF